MSLMELNRSVAKLGTVLPIYSKFGFQPPIPRQFSIGEARFKLCSIGVLSPDHMSSYCFNDDGDWYIDNENKIATKENFIGFFNSADNSVEHAAFDEIQKQLCENGTCKPLVVRSHTGDDSKAWISGGLLPAADASSAAHGILEPVLLIYERIDDGAETTIIPDATYDDNLPGCQDLRFSWSD